MTDRELEEAVRITLAGIFRQTQDILLERGYGPLESIDGFTRASADRPTDRQITMQLHAPDVYLSEKTHREVAQKLAEAIIADGLTQFGELDRPLNCASSRKREAAGLSARAIFAYVEKPLVDEAGQLILDEEGHPMSNPFDLMPVFRIDVLGRPSPAKGQA